MSSLHELSAHALVGARRNGEISAVELVAHFLGRSDALNHRVNALVTVAPEQALARAKAMDRHEVEPGVLWGLPFADKDLTHRQGMVTGFGSRTRDTAEPERATDPLGVRLDDAGGISLGKTAVCEFGLTSYTESEVFPPTINPYAPGYGSGGSSGGAAAAVAAGILPVAPGSDGGGSVRIPAWTCGVVGHKPSRGLIPAGTGMESPGGLVVPGPIARSVEDAALFLDAMRGSSPTFRATGHDGAPASFLDVLHHEPGALRVAVTTKSPWDDWTDIRLDPLALNALHQAAQRARDLGHTVIEWDWQPPGGYAEAFQTVWSTSAALLEVPQEKKHLLEPLTRHLVERGSQVSAATLMGALRVLSAWERTVIEQFSAFDVVLTPGLATRAPEIGYYDPEDPELNFRQQVQVTPFSSFVNVCGLPALALPVMADPEGRPVGVQLIGGPGQDARVLQLAASMEELLGWRGTRPGLW